MFEYVELSESEKIMATLTVSSKGQIVLPAGVRRRLGLGAGAKMEIKDGKLVIEKEGKIKKLVKACEQITFSGRRGVAQGQDVTYITERCVMKLTPDGIVVTEIAPGVSLQENIIDQSEFPLIISPKLKVMDTKFFRDKKMGSALHG